MKLENTNISGAIIIEPDIHTDHRGFFLETYHAERYLDEARIGYIFVQDNHSHSTKNVLRGLHFQNTKPQGKLVHVVNGLIFDVIVDTRKNSRTFSKWVGVMLSAENRKQLWVPPGLAHGFVTLSDSADVIYKCTDYYKPHDEYCLRWDDLDIGITWPIENPILSKKDAAGQSFQELFA